MIRLQEARKVYNQGKPNEYVALDSVSLEIEAVKLTVIKGPSGSGKTTLLSLIGCMARPSSGRIFLEDREVTSLPERFLTDIRRRTFGFIFQHFNLIHGLSALENVMIPAYPSGERFIPLRRRALELLDLFGVRHRAKEKVECLSGGEAQRVSIARALINDPPVVIADEPTAHLDSRLSLEFMDIMGRLKERPKTILIASHDPIVSDSAAVDRLFEIRDGRIGGDGG
jgi:putative ABC transport system ATP-binding protein